MILVDTSVWIDYFNGNETWQTAKLNEYLSTESVLMGDIILAEILQGFDKKDDFNRAKTALTALECVLLGGKEQAISVAKNFRFLRSKGVTIRKTVDMFIGTWCMEAEVELLHNDRDFEQIALHLPLNTIQKS